MAEIAKGREIFYKKKIAEDKREEDHSGRLVWSEEGKGILGGSYQQ